MLRGADVFKFGFTDGCPACQMIISGRIPERGGNKLHTEPCRERMEAILQGTPEGQEKLQRYIDKSNEVIAREMERVFDEEQAAKKARVAKPMDQGGAFDQGEEAQVDGKGVGGQKRAHTETATPTLTAGSESSASGILFIIIVEQAVQDPGA